MRGYVREIQVEFPEDASGAQVTVTVQDESLRLDREHKRRGWGTENQPTTDATIVGSIAVNPA